MRPVADDKDVIATMTREIHIAKTAKKINLYAGKASKHADPKEPKDTKAKGGSVWVTFAGDFATQRHRSQSGNDRRAEAFKDARWQEREAAWKAAEVKRITEEKAGDDAAIAEAVAAIEPASSYAQGLHAWLASGKVLVKVKNASKKYFARGAGEQRVRRTKRAKRVTTALASQKQGTTFVANFMASLRKEMTGVLRREEVHAPKSKK
jgi:hypothetical protein